MAGSNFENILGNVLGKWQEIKRAAFLQPFIYMARPEGFEPPTAWFVARQEVQQNQGIRPFCFWKCKPLCPRCDAGSRVYFGKEYGRMVGETGKELTIRLPSSLKRINATLGKFTPGALAFIAHKHLNAPRSTARIQPCKGKP